MSLPGAFIRGIGVVCALGTNRDEILKAVSEGRSGLAPVKRFIPAHASPFPVGEVPPSIIDPSLPVCHQLAAAASQQAMGDCSLPPDAIVLGVTTGGMDRTEILLKSGCTDSSEYTQHAIGTVAENLARRYHCKGPVLTISTACSSSGGAMALALAMLQSGKYRRILVGGADSLCRLTYYGFKSLQLLDPEGAKPLDQDRRGMSVAEGAGMLMLDIESYQNDGTELIGAGLSCDAHHPAQPHPSGRGAITAIQAALSSAGLTVDNIDYINLHGTGTVDNDRSEAAAIRSLFSNKLPQVSSVKGATGHSLAAAGTIEAAVAVVSMTHGLIPANTGLRIPDRALNLMPVQNPAHIKINTVLSNSFGFGGNNAAVIIGRSRQPASNVVPIDMAPLFVSGWSAVTGAGLTDQTIDNLLRGVNCKGQIDTKALCEGLPTSAIRRVKRLSHMAMALLANMQKQPGCPSPHSIYFGTGWGCLSETNAFLENLFTSDEKFCSPTDFIGSVHNAPAGQIAIMAQATKANMTLSGGEYSFEQALFAAQVMTTGNKPVMVFGADEAHPKLTPLFAPSVVGSSGLSDGGGALILHRSKNNHNATVALKYFKTDFEHWPDPCILIEELGGPDRIKEAYDLILVGMPAAQRSLCKKQWDRFEASSGYSGPVIDYRRLIGQFATASAVATVFAVSLVTSGAPIPTPLTKGLEKGPNVILILGLGSALTAIEVSLT